jgi:hypothetical protein
MIDVVVSDPPLLTVFVQPFGTAMPTITSLATLPPCLSTRFVQCAPPVRLCSRAGRCRARIVEKYPGADAFGVETINIKEATTELNAVRRDAATASLDVTILYLQVVQHAFRQGLPP